MDKQQRHIQRTFIPGSSWLYYKIYSGTTTANMVLTQTLLPLTETLLEQNIIREWFFIRYHDPEPHLRIRFLLADVSQLGTIMTAMRHQLQPYIEQELVWKLQLDTYQRELERYGAATIKVSETLFYHDSVMVAKALDLIDDPELKLFFVLKAIDQLLDVFQLNTADKLSLTQSHGAGFKQEFHADKTVNKQLDVKYRRFRVDLEIFLGPHQKNSDYQPLWDLLEDKKQGIQSVVSIILEHQQNNTLEVPLHNLLGSYIHMLVNRYFDTRQRLYEMVCYDFLNRYYRAIIGKERSMKNNF